MQLGKILKAVGKIMCAKTLLNFLAQKILMLVYFIQDIISNLSSIWSKFEFGNKAQNFHLVN